MDCIYEVPSEIPSESFHQIDTSRCIGCQLCYRIPTESTEHYTLEICPWNAIDMLHNPNVKPDESVLLPYYQGENAAELPWPKLEEYGYQFFLDGTVFLPTHEEAFHAILEHLKAPDWFYDDDLTGPDHRGDRPKRRLRPLSEPRPRAGMCWTWFTKATSGFSWIDPENFQTDSGRRNLVWHWGQRALRPSIVGSAPVEFERKLALRAEDDH